MGSSLPENEFVHYILPIAHNTYETYDVYPAEYYYNKENTII